MTTATIPQQAARLAEQAKAKVIDFADLCWELGTHGERCDCAPGRHSREAVELAIAALVTLITAESLRLDWLLARHTERGSKLIGLGFYPDKQEQRRMIQMAIDAGTCVVDEVDAIEVRKVRLDEARDAERYRSMTDDFRKMLSKMRALVEAMPVREEFLSGQRFAYVKQADMIDLFNLFDAPITGAGLPQAPAPQAVPEGWLPKTYPSNVHGLISDAEYLKLFDEARKGSDKPCGTIRGIRAVIAAYETAAPQAVVGEATRVANIFAQQNGWDGVNGAPVWLVELAQDIAAALTPSPAPSAAPHQGADALREVPSLLPVIQWLEAGCDPQKAADELRLYEKARAALAQHQAPQQTAPQGQEAI